MVNEPVERQPSVASVLAQMEEDVGDVRRWGDALSVMGTAPSLISAGSVYVIGEAVIALGQRLADQYEQLVALAHHKRLDGSQLVEA